MDVIEVEHLTKDYGSNRGVFDVSFSVGEGEVFGFLGPNGAGKSTTIRHLMGFSKPDKGKTKIFGEESFSKYDHILRNVGYIPGEIALPAGLTGWEFISMMQHMHGIKNPSKLNELMELFELDPSGETKRMSLGIKRKLAVVTAFMSDPDVLILDEPTSGLDPLMQEIFIDYVKNEKKKGKTILLSSHIFSEVDATCDRIAIIKDGRIVSDFIADDLRHATQKRYLVSFSGKTDMDVFIAETSDSSQCCIVETNMKENSVLIETNDRYINEIINTLSRHSVLGFSHQKETLEDYFMKYYREDKDFGGTFQK
ncbi:MAG: ABC transporter ATP-binding protein [Anaerolineaceae bacterium]|nr:ABC transporter ATP-binding protein [Anaerolineaceae bacterium]